MNCKENKLGKLKDPDNLNLNGNEEYATKCMVEIFKYEVNFCKMQGKVTTWKEKDSSLYKSIEKGSWLTSGVLYKHR